MQVTVGTTAVQLAIDSSVTPVIQNLGPGTIYIDHDADVTTATGFRIEVGAVYEFPRDLARNLFLVADAPGTDVRVLEVG